MLTLEDLQINNWVFYDLDGFYCTVKSTTPTLYISGVMRQNMQCELHHLSPVVLNEYMTSLFGFTETNKIVAKKLVSTTLTIYYRFEGYSSTIWINEEEKFRVSYVHEFQNRYFSLSGQPILPNLYGMREP